MILILIQKIKNYFNIFLIENYFKWNSYITLRERGSNLYPIIGKSQMLSAQIKQDHSNQNPNLT